MFRSILVPLDGSAWSERALPLAEKLAQAAGARLLLARVHVPITQMYVAGGDLVGVQYVDEEADREAWHNERDYLARVRARLEERGLHVATAILEGQVADALLRAASAENVDLIVMTTHGRGAFSRMWLGGVADAVLRQSAIPTLLVRAGGGADAPELVTNVQHILVPLDGSSLAEQILDPVTTLAQLIGANVTLVQVIDPVPVAAYSIHGSYDLEHEFLDERAAQVRNYLCGVTARLRADGLTVDARILLSTQPASAILHAAQRNPTTMIALATHGRGGLRRLLIGSVADKVVRGANAPVLVYRPTAQASEVDQHEHAHGTVLV